MNITELAPRHQSALRGWLDDFLRQQIGWWAAAFDLGWGEARIGERIEAGEMLDRETKRLQTAAADANSFVRIAEQDGGDVVGIVYALVRDDSYLGVPIGTLCWVYVDPDRRGQKIGEALHRAALDWMRERGAVGSDLFVTAENSPAERLYRRLGYRTTDFRMLSALRDS